VEDAVDLFLVEDVAEPLVGGRGAGLPCAAGWAGTCLTPLLAWLCRGRRRSDPCWAARGRIRPPPEGIASALQERGRRTIYLVLHCNENPIYVFLFWELRGLSPNFHHVSVRDLYIPRIGLHISCSRIGRIYKSLTDT
jgi:hypothetical protein